MFRSPEPLDVGTRIPRVRISHPEFGLAKRRQAENPGNDGAGLVQKFRLGSVYENCCD